MRVRRVLVTMALTGLLLATLACNLPSPTSTPSVVVTESAAPTEESTPVSPESPVAPVEDGLAPATASCIVYSDAGSLWVVQGEEARRQLTSGGADDLPLISPDGTWVLFQREALPGPAGLPRFELRVIGLDGSEERQVVSPEDLPGVMGAPAGSDTEVLLDRLPMQVAWLPSGQAIAFNTRIESGYGLATQDDLWLADLVAGTVTQVLADGEGGTFAFSPDGAWVVVSTPTTVTMLDANGGNRRTLVEYEFVNTASEYAFEPMPVWSPDGSYALVAISSSEPFGPDGPAGDLWRLPLEGEAVRLASLQGEFLLSAMGDQLWSPDRTRIAYRTMDLSASPPVSSLAVANADGSNSEMYAQGEVELLAWSPDSQLFVFRWDGEFYLGQVGEEPVPLSPPAIVAAKWVDADTLVSVVEAASGFDVRLVHVDGSYRTVAASLDPFPYVDVCR